MIPITCQSMPSAEAAWTNPTTSIGAGEKKERAIAEAGGFAHVVGDENDRLAPALPDLLKIAVCCYPFRASSAANTSSIRRTRGFGASAGQSDTLFHPTEK